MDDYLSKPYSPAQLQELLERWISRTPARGAGLAAVESPAAAEAEAVLDHGALEQIRERDLDAGSDVVGRIIAAYLEQSAEHVTLLGEALAGGDAAAVAAAAHTLKSSSAMVGAARLASICADIEQKARVESIEGLDAKLDPLREMYSRVCSALERVRRQDAA